MKNNNSFDHIAAGRELIKLIEKEPNLSEHAQKLSESIDTASTGNELVFRLRFYIARMIALEEHLPKEILSKARRLFRTINELIESDLKDRT